MSVLCSHPSKVCHVETADEAEWAIEDADAPEEPTQKLGVFLCLCVSMSESVGACVLLK